MQRKKFLLIIFFLILLISVLNINFLTGGNIRNDLSFYIVKSVLPNELKIKIKNKINHIIQYRNYPNLLYKNQVLDEKYKLLDQKLQSIDDRHQKEIEKLKLEKNKVIDVFNLRSKKTFSVEKEINEQINSPSSLYKLTKYKIKNLMIPKHQAAKSTGYIEEYEKNIIIGFANGIFMFIDKGDLTKTTFDAKVLRSNITDIVPYSEFYYGNDTGVGLKDLFIYGDKLYVSYIKKDENNCYTISIMFSEINFNELYFEEFFTPNEVVCQNDPTLIDGMTAHIAGGRMVAYGPDKLLLSTGDFKKRQLPQDKESILGKIISIDLETKDIEIMSLGHRNVQGLKYNSIGNFIISSEHGPIGGDEINLNINPRKTEIPNYGWPYASNGKHYNDKISKKFPLYNSHLEGNFSEPLIDFTPGIGISEIIEVPRELRFKSSYFEYFVASMGTSWSDPKKIRSLIHIEFDDKFKNQSILDQIFIGERIRDLINSQDGERVILFLEDSPAIGILDLVYRKK